MVYNLVLAIILFWSLNTYAYQHNIILILSDDQSWAGLSVKMDPSIELSNSLYDHTPNLEILSKQGVIFVMLMPLRQFVHQLELAFKQAKLLQD